MTGPVIKLEDSQPVKLASTRWRTLAPMQQRPSGWARDDRERCPSCCGTERRCMLREGHEGLHAWRSLGGLRVFEWS